MLTSIVTVALWAAKAPTDEQLKTLCRDASYAMQTATSNEAKQAAFDNAANKLAKQADLSKITAAQVEMVFETGGITLQPYLSRWLAPTLESKASQADFAFYAWKYMPREDMFHATADEVAKLKRFLDNTDLQTTIGGNTEMARDIINALGNLKDTNWATEGFAQSVLSFLGKSLPDASVLECVKVFNSAIYAESLSQQTREDIRKAVLKQYTDMAAKTETARIKKSCQTQIEYLEGPFAKGTLVGSKAPNLHFTRYFINEGDSVVTRAITDLHSLTQGVEGIAHADAHPVIMLDFWATKCVPCLQSFPELAEIQQHFAGAGNIVILGITSLQGYFIDKPNNRTVQCRNNPEKELGLFPDYMKAMGMTWNVAVTEEDVMNTDYGALAIPHIVLIDKQGRVRYNALTAEKEEKIKLIEELLNE